MSTKSFLTIVYLTVFAMTGLAEAQYQKPTVEQASRVSLGQALNGGDLERMKVGHQAGILKILNDNDEVLFLKGAGTAAGAGVDSRELAPLNPADRDKILMALKISDPNAMARSLLNNYNRVSREHALALLGVLAYPGEDTTQLKPHLREEVLQFIRGRLQPREDDKVRRQAVVALAVQPQTDAHKVRRWAVRSGFHLVREQLAQGRWLYEILTFRRRERADPAYQDVDHELGFHFGPHLIKSRHALLKEELLRRRELQEDHPANVELQRVTRALAIFEKPTL